MESNSVERDEGEWERIRRNPVSAEKSLFESLLGISSTAGLSWLDRSHGRGTLPAIIASLRRMNSSKRSGMCCYSCCCYWTTNTRQRHSDGQTAENPFQIHYINRSCSRHRSRGWWVVVAVDAHTKPLTSRQEELQMFIPGPCPSRPYN